MSHIATELYAFFILGQSAFCQFVKTPRGPRWQVASMLWSPFPARAARKKGTITWAQVSPATCYTMTNLQVQFISDARNSDCAVKWITQLFLECYCLTLSDPQSKRTENQVASASCSLTLLDGRCASRISSKFVKMRERIERAG